MTGWNSEEFLKEVTAETKMLTAVKKPRKFKVILLNDDYTPMDFVVEVLEQFFSLNVVMATQVMLQVHFLGKGICGTYTRDIAETKVAQVNDYARSKEHPLLCIMEPE